MRMAYVTQAQVRRKQGFSLLEIVIVVAIISVLTVIVIGSFSSFRNRQGLEGATHGVLAALSRARSQTLSGKNSYAYGVHLTASAATIFRGMSYDPATTTNESFVLDSRFEIATISLAGGGQDVRFARLTGKTSDTGTFIVRQTGDASVSRTISVNGEGIVFAD